MELTKRRIKKVNTEQIIPETNIIEYKVGDILKYYTKSGDKIEINYGHLVIIVNKDIFKISNIKNNLIQKVDRKDVVKKIDDYLYFDSISSIYYLLFRFLILQILMFSCYYLYTIHNKDFIIMGNIVIKNFNVFIETISKQLIIPKNNFNLFIKNATTQLIIHKDKIIVIFYET
jgi:hypothetical protein